MPGIPQYVTKVAGMIAYLGLVFPDTGAYKGDLGKPDGISPVTN
jgi:hypothetical protein